MRAHIMKVEISREERSATENMPAVKYRLSGHHLMLCRLNNVDS